MSVSQIRSPQAGIHVYFYRIEEKKDAGDTVIRPAAAFPFVYAGTHHQPQSAQVQRLPDKSVA